MRWRVAGIGYFLVFAVVALGSSERAHAPIIEFSYTEFAKGIWRTFSEVSAARGLTPDESDLAQRVATAWFHLGPCRGSNHLLEGDGFGALQYVATARPDRPAEAAVLEMIAIMTRLEFGREPSDYTCKFALETAVPQRPVN